MGFSMNYRLRTRRGLAAAAGLMVVTGCEMVSEKLAVVGKVARFSPSIGFRRGQGWNTGGSPTPAR